MSRRALIVVAVALAMLAVPTSAMAYSIHNFKIRDAGPEIVAKVTVCTYPPAGYEHKFEFRVHVEASDGSDARTVGFYGWYGRGCTEGSNVFRDTLRYRGYYFGRVRVRLAQTDWVRLTGWRRFWTS